MIDYEVISKVVNLLKEKKYTISCAESCTGGLISSSIVSVSGASDIFNEGYVTYSNEAKHRILSVNKDKLEKYGAVSSEVAFEMCNGLYNVTGCNICISTTGIAGPTGGSLDKPVGLVYIGIYNSGKTDIYKNIFNGDRTQVREQTVNIVFAQLLKDLV